MSSSKVGIVHRILLELRTICIGSAKPPKEREEKQMIRKSNVRVYVTYISAIFLFGIGIGLIIIFTLYKEEEEPDYAMIVFNAILPIAAGIVTYWFATRSNRTM